MDSSHAMHTKALIRHEEAQTYKTERKKYAANLEKMNALDRRTMSLVVPESPPPSPLSPSPTFPAPKMSFLAERIDRLKRLKLKQLVFESKIQKSAGYDMDSFPTPELASARPLDMDSQWRM